VFLGPLASAAVHSAVTSILEQPEQIDVAAQCSPITGRTRNRGLDVSQVRTSLREALFVIRNRGFDLALLVPQCLTVRRPPRTRSPLPSRNLADDPLQGLWAPFCS
jgi:hypothetical protein